MLKILKRLTVFSLGIFLVYFVSSQLYIVFTTKGVPTDVSFGFLVIGTVFYFISHFFRSIRLLILSADANISLRALMSAQYIANGVNLLLPFRLGEVYRVIRFREFFGTGYRSFLFLVIERLFDFSLILGLLLTLHIFYGTVDFTSFLGSVVIWFGLLFFIGIALVFFILDDLLEAIQRYIIQRYTSNRANVILKIIFYIRQSITEISTILNKKGLSCLSLTFLIWGLEILVFVGFYSITGSLDSILYLAVFVFFASLLPSGPIGYGGVQLAFYYVGQYWDLADFIGYSIWYNIFIFAPAIMVAFILSLISIREGKNKNSN